MFSEISLRRLAADVETMEMSDLREAFEVPRELASAMERLESKQMRRSVELMGQCVQVQRSAHGVLMHAIEAQEALKGAIMDKVCSALRGHRFLKGVFVGGHGVILS